MKKIRQKVAAWLHALANRVAGGPGTPEDEGKGGP